MLTATGRATLDRLGVAVANDPGAVVCCVDWTEQRHHVAGPVGRALLGTLRERDWVRSAGRSRAVAVTDAGREALSDRLGLSWPLPHGPARMTPVDPGRE